MRHALSFLLLLSGTTALAQFTPTKEPVSPDGVRATADLPASQQHRNVGGSDGAGLCVYTSAWHASIWQDERGIFDFREWMRRRPGGSYPEKFDATLKQFCAERGIPVPGYVQHTGGDVEFLELALRTGRMVCVTYCGVDGAASYGGEVIAHMVNLVYLDATRAAILDNNFPGRLLWMTRAQFLERWLGRKADGTPFRIGRTSVGGGWAIVFLAPPPPPYPAAPGAQMLVGAGPGPCICGDDCKCASKGKTCPGGCPVLVGAASPWGSYADAYKASKADGKPMFVVVGSESCPACVRLEKSLKDETLVQLLSGFACAKVDGNTDANTRRLLGVEAYPTVIVSDASMKVVARLQGFQTPDALLKAAKLASPRQVAAAPALAAPQTADPFPGGVVSEKLEDVSTWSISGVTSAKREAMAAIALDDDSTRWNLTAVGDPAFVAKVKADVAKMPERAKLHVQGFAADSWQAGQFKLAPGVTLRKPATGRVGSDVGTLPASDYSADKLAGLMQLPGGPTPKADPIPAPTPAPTPAPAPTPKPAPAPEPEPAPQPAPDGIPAWLAAIVLGILAWLAARPKK